MSEPVPYDISDEAAMRVADDPVIQALMKNIDRAAIRENLKLTPEQRLLKLQRISEQLESKGEWPQQVLELKEVAASPQFGALNRIEAEAQSAEHRPGPFPFDPVVEAYQKDVDRTLLRETLKLTPTQRALQLEAMNEFIEELQKAGARMRAEDH